MKIATIRQKVLASFGAILLVLVAIGSFGYLRLEEIEQESVEVQNGAVPGLYLSSLIKTHLTKAMDTQRATS